MNKKLLALKRKRDVIYAKWKKDSLAINTQIAMLSCGLEVGCTLIGEDGEKLVVTGIDDRHRQHVSDISIFGLVSAPKRISMADVERGYWKKVETEAEVEVVR